MPFTLNKNLLNNNVSVTVQIGDSPLQQLINLNLDDNLSNIRKELEKNKIIDDTLSFSKKIYDEFSEITSEEVLLKEIVEIKDEKYFLYLIKNLPDWETLNGLHKLDYGCTVTFDEIKMATERVFKIKDCKLTRIDGEGYRSGKLEFEPQDDWTKKTNFFFNINDIKTKDKIKSSYKEYTELGKVTLELITENLELTDNFKNDIENAIESEDPEKFREIAKKYGQFIATKVILGGRFYLKSNHMPSKTNHGLESNSGNSKIKSTSYSFDYMQLLEGKHFFENFDEKDLIESLKDCRSWERIGLQEIDSIFQLLPDDLRERILVSIGKRILYSDVKDYDFVIKNKDKEPNIVDLKCLGVPTNISNILLDEAAKCRVFATVVDMEESKNDFFNCQILSSPGGKPSLIIHCIRISEKIDYKIKIGIMIAGYDIDLGLESKDKLKVLEHKVTTLSRSDELLLPNFNCKSEPYYIGIPVLNRLDTENNSLIIGHHFYKQENQIGVWSYSYCLNKGHYVDLPKSKIYILIISHYDRRHNYETLPYASNALINTKFFQLQCARPPIYISLYSKGGCGPIFPKQKNNQIKIKYLECNNCKKIRNFCSICKRGKLSIKNIECKVFRPFYKVLYIIIYR
jgi:hypothetical protein